VTETAQARPAASREECANRWRAVAPRLERVRAAGGGLVTEDWCANTKKFGEMLAAQAELDAANEAGRKLAAECNSANWRAWCSEQTEQIRRRMEAAVAEARRVGIAN